MKKVALLFAVASFVLSGCKKSNSEPKSDPAGPKIVEMMDSLGWFRESACPENLELASYTVETDTAIKLEFYGWAIDKDRRFELQMPTEGSYRRVLMEYKMCAWNEGCSDWDMVTEIWVKNPADGEWYELQRAITPYGRSFKAGWEKNFYMDVTHLLPILMQQQTAEFKIYYGGFDASATRAHAVKLKFYFFEGENQYGKPIYSAKVYDSFTSGNNGYRAWAYGIDTASIEDDARLGHREIQLPPGTKKALLRVCITGHGQELTTSEETQGHPYQGYFPGRTFPVRNPAEFDKNWYTVVYNREEMPERGFIWEINSDNYSQAGNCKYDRAGWGPGKPANTHYWWLNEIPADGRITLDLNLDEYVSNCTAPNAAYVANYYVMADIFAFE